MRSVKKLKDSHHLFYYRGKENGKTNGVGFLNNLNVADNVSKFGSISDRVAWILFKLNKRYTPKEIQVYTPTSQSSEEDIKSFYEDISSIIDREKFQYTIVMGDFNAKVGIKIAGESCIGKFGIGEHNDTGEISVNFAERCDFRIMNTFF